jgi:HEAT repeat protein
MSLDTDKRVRVLCAVGLGMAGGAGAFNRLTQLLASGDPIIRENAAKGLATLGDPRGMGVLCTFSRENDDLAQREMRVALAQLALRITSLPTLGDLLRKRQGDDLVALIEASFPIGDPRLCVPLTDVLKGTDEQAARYAARSLAANGDSRALGPLCQVAANATHAELRNTAAETLQQLTGYGAAAGPAWTLWWKEHREAIEALHARDELIAALHDPVHVVTRAELAAFTTDQLGAVVDGALEPGNSWWPSRAFMVLQADDRQRWTKPLLDRIAATTEPNRRLALIIILDQLGDPAAVDGFSQLLESDRKEGPARKISDGPERLALSIALQRRGVAVP